MHPQLGGLGLVGVARWLRAMSKFSIVVRYEGRDKTFSVNPNTKPAALEAEMANALLGGAGGASKPTCKLFLRLDDVERKAGAKNRDLVVPVDASYLCPGYAYKLVVVSGAADQKASGSEVGQRQVPAQSEDAVFVPTDADDQAVSAIWDYKARAPHELSFRAGDSIVVLGQFDKNWWKGRLGDKVGYFPHNYVSGLEAIELDSSSDDEGSAGAWQDDEYFGEYSGLKIHLEMLSDEPRTAAYRTAVRHLSPLIRGRTVLDVGCGTGILSIMCAQAGAKRVLAVDASDIVHKATKKVVAENGFVDIIDLFQGRIEDIKLPVKTVDVIISEWMGTFLIAESMLSSVLHARDTYLSKQGGMLMPSHASIQLAPVSDPEFWAEKINFWSGDVHGVRMNSLRKLAKEEFLRRPTHDRVLGSEALLAAPRAVEKYNLATMHFADVGKLDRKIEFEIKNSATMHAFGAWFDVTFRGGPTRAAAGAPGDATPPVILSTSPMSPPTHWKQALFYLRNPAVVSAGDRVAVRVRLEQNPNYLRHFRVHLSIKIKGQSGAGGASVAPYEAKHTYYMWR